ncbi:superoxide dismutase [Cu-Zn]-like isoform X2 [Venturia canescens]|nr:superoxide dismutase [Cu-Zn]-like isoform X2 [Venturia canescens]XP_043272685.1 superoxide dismutase [Cu-Zn]-like isoform X2 [Venturia canescens]XP_043272686.1 superoxide dismutase [Cu-Zn]-like isoform X2 [Venturia canescens]
MNAIVLVLAIAALCNAQNMQATVKMTPHDPSSNVTGVLYMMQQGPSAPVVITGNLTGLSPGLHGFHVHEKGDLSNGCLSTGAHFNPFNHSHGAPQDPVRHAGDLGNVLANDGGVVNVHITDTVINLTGENNILGLSIVIHSAPDDLGKGGHPLSSTTGNAGSRVACGVIGRM